MSFKNFFETTRIFKFLKSIGVSYSFCFSLIFILGILLSFFSFYVIKESRDLENEFQFFREAEVASHFIEKSFSDYTLSLDFLSFLFSSGRNENVSYSRFVNLTQIVKKLHPNLMTIEYLPFVRKKEILSFQKKARSVFPNYELKVASRKGQVKKMAPPYLNEYIFPVYYTVPLSEENKEFLGFDTFSSSVHKGAIVKAIETGLASSTIPFSLFREKTPSYKSFIVYKAVYDKNKPQNTKEEKWAATLGMVSVVIQVDEVLKDASSFKLGLHEHGLDKNTNRVDQQLLNKWEKNLNYGFYFFYYPQTSGSKKQVDLIYKSSSGKNVADWSRKGDLNTFYQSFIEKEKHNKYKKRRKTIFSVPLFIYSHGYSWIGQNFKWVISFRGSKNSLIFYWDVYLVLFFGVLFSCFLARFVTNLLRKKVFFQRELEAKAREAKLNKSYFDVMMNTVYQGIISINEKGIIQFINLGTKRIFLYDSKELVGKNVKILMTKEEAVLHEASLKRYKEEQSRVVGKKIQKGLHGVRKNGEVFPLSLAVNEVKIEDQKNKRIFIGTIEDLTKEKNEEEKMKETIDKLSSLNSDLEYFNYIASHDLQEPLRVISNFVDLLNERLLKHQFSDEKIFNYIDVVLSSTKRMRCLLKDLLEYSRADHSLIRAKEVAIDGVISSVLGNLQDVIKKSGAKISYENLPVIICEPAILVCLLQNLIANGIKYQKKGSQPHVVIASKESSDGWTFSVKDNGIGIKKDYFSKVFLPFKRLHAYQEYKGTGVGLAICKKVLEKLRGSIWVESEEGKGSTFYFTIPKISKTTQTLENENSDMRVASGQ